MRIKTMKEQKANAEQQIECTHDDDEKAIWHDVVNLWDMAIAATEVARKAVEAASMAHGAANAGERVRL